MSEPSSDTGWPNRHVISTIGETIGLIGLKNNLSSLSIPLMTEVQEWSADRHRHEIAGKSWQYHQNLLVCHLKEFSGTKH